MRKIKWCFSAKGGLKVTEPSREVALSYLNEAEKTLSKIKKLIDDEDFIWASVRIYYCAYYSLYAFLQKIGLKSENHDCTIKIMRELLGEKLLGNIEDFKKERISSQYHLKTGQKSKILRSYSLVKEFHLSFRKIIFEISEENIKDYRSRIRRMI